MKVVVGADHAGYPLKVTIVDHLTASGHDVVDVGTFSTEPVDYPDYAAAVARGVRDGDGERGIVVCGSGAGASIADHYTAHQAVEHDDMNVLALGARVIGDVTATEIVDAFLGARFTGEERHARRLQKLNDLDRNRM